MNNLTSAGGSFAPNGDLIVSYHFPPFLLTQVVGFRRGVKIVLERWAERRCGECGCPEQRYHAMGCSNGGGL